MKSQAQKLAEELENVHISFIPSSLWSIISDFKSLYARGRQIFLTTWRLCIWTNCIRQCCENRTASVKLYVNNKKRFSFLSGVGVIAFFLLISIWHPNFKNDSIVIALRSHGGAFEWYQNTTTLPSPLSLLSVSSEVLLPTPFVQSTTEPVWNCSTAFRPTAVFVLGVCFFQRRVWWTKLSFFFRCVIKETNIECG